MEGPAKGQMAHLFIISDSLTVENLLDWEAIRDWGQETPPGNISLSLKPLLFHTLPTLLRFFLIS